ncbi:hypothetical protein BJY21_003258 [Kineosphaera limosa]|uniref:Uncharacterized protein n=1 Tax=Kineosphaera limosa NBRC 100340 TaxID=1184609 RepID=K6X950_9MICO|nr:hypothetical protein [Kineosphaera limosa]GAB95324.1 hypothetical protein KILIM_018_00720 [Kineosphaera limosa NBRC 100340]
MQGFAVLDRQPASAVVVVWQTTRVAPSRAAHANAVSVDLDSDAEGLRKVHSLTRDFAVLATEGSDLRGLPLAARQLTSADLELLVRETTERRIAIQGAVRDYIARTRRRAAVVPTFPELISVATPCRGTPVERTLRLANNLAQLWSQWLATDEERRRRTVDSRGVTPWMMPEGLDSPAHAIFPRQFGMLIEPQPWGAFSA